MAVEVRHQQGCRAKGKDARRCSCSPGVRVQVHVGGDAKKWVSSGRLPKGWALVDLAQFEVDGRQSKLDHDSGRRIVQREIAPTFGEIAATWLAGIEQAVLLGELSPNTLVGYRSMLNAHLLRELADLKVTQLDADRIERLRVTLATYERGKGRTGYTQNYITQAVSVVSTILKDSGTVGRWLDHNPCATRARRRRRRGRRGNVGMDKGALDLLFVNALLHHTAGTLIGDMTLTAMLTGMRQREVAGLKDEHLHSRERRIEVANQRVRHHGDAPTKGFDDRVTVLSGPLSDRLMLRAEQTTNGYLFNCRKTGLPWSAEEQARQLKQAWGQVAAQVPEWSRKYGQGWHAFRHTFASLLDQHRVRPLVIDALMGHKNQGVSFRYRHVWDSDFDEVIDILDGVFGGLPTLAGASAR